MTEKMAISDKILYGGLLAAAGALIPILFSTRTSLCRLTNGELNFVGDGYWSNEMGGIINATHYPILAFMLGTILTLVVQHHFKEADSH